MAKKVVKTSKKKTSAKKNVVAMKKVSPKKKAVATKKALAKKKVSPKKKAVATKKALAKKKVSPKKKAVATKRALAKKKVSPKKKAVVKKKASVAKKASSKKKTSTKKKSTRKKAHLSRAELNRFRQVLLVKRREILGNVTEIEKEALKQSRGDAAGDLSSMPIHMADLGTDNYEQEFALGLMDNERRLIRQIDDALARISEGTYGYCEGTGKPIRKARLEAKPWARYCVEYAQLVEDGKVPEFEE